MLFHHAPLGLDDRGQPGLGDRGGPHNQVGGQLDVVRVDLFAGSKPQRGPQCHRAHLAQRLPDGRQWGDANRASRVSSNPTMLRSSGTRSPRLSTCRHRSAGRRCRFR